MKSLIIGLLSMCLINCSVYGDPSYASTYAYGNVTICDDFGCRNVSNVRYFVGADNVTYYYDTHFGVWIGPGGYWDDGRFYHGYYAGYHTYYHSGWYHGSHGYHPGGGHGGGHGNGRGHR